MTDVITVWVIAISAMTAQGGAVGASSLPHSWPTEEACKAEAVQAQKYIEETRPDLHDVEVRCVPHRKLEGM